MPTNEGDVYTIVDWPSTGRFKYTYDGVEYEVDAGRGGGTLTVGAYGGRQDMWTVTVRGNTEIGEKKELYGTVFQPDRPKDNVIFRELHPMSGFVYKLIPAAKPSNSNGPGAPTPRRGWLSYFRGQKPPSSTTMGGRRKSRRVKKRHASRPARTRTRRSRS